MVFIDITHQPEQNPNPKLQGKLNNLQQLLKELQQRKLPATAIDYINNELKELNANATTDPKLYRIVCAKQNCILKYLEKQHKIVSKGYYQQLWMPIGMSVFGIPMGLAFGVALDNFAFLGIGLPIGMAIGMAVGAGMDQKAAAEGRQLRFKGDAL